MSAIDKIRELVKSVGTAEALAEEFCEMDDDQQAQFFVHAARIMDDWKGGSCGRDMQAFYIGRHLRTCTCATESARELVKEIARAIDSP